jgi:hypothetical protein
LPERRVLTGERFWESLRSELARTRYTSVRKFTDEQLPHVLDEFGYQWDSMHPLEIDEPIIAPHVRVARFEAPGWRFWVTGIERQGGSIELFEIDIETWPRPTL